MSYILDALKKAEAERNPGSNPNPHAPPTAEFSTFNRHPASAHPPRAAPWIWAGMTASALAIAALAWLKPWQTPAAPVVVAASSPTPATPSAPVIAAPAPAQPAPVPAPAAAPVEAPAPPSARSSPPRQEASPATARPESRKAATPKQPAEKKVPKETTRAPAAQPAPAKEPKAKPSPAPATEQRVPTLQELPAHIQNEIPRLAVSGYIYSTNKADRTVLINTRLAREGDQVAPDVILEQLTPTGMVLSYKGYRYRTSY